MTKSVRIRVAVAVRQDGEWYAKGACLVSDAALLRDVRVLSPDCACYWLTADLPIPTVPEIEAEVERG